MQQITANVSPVNHVINIYFPVLLSQEKCHQYWPAERSARYQYFVVDPMAEYNMPQYILREFKVTDARVRSLKTSCSCCVVVSKQQSE